MDPRKETGPVVIKRGYIPPGSLALDIARDVANSCNTTVVITDATATMLDIQEGLPITFEVAPLTQSQN